MYRSFVEAGKFLTDEQRWKYYTLIFDQMFDFVAGSSDDNMVNAMFMLISPQIEANIIKYNNWSKAKNKLNGSKIEAKDKQTESQTEGNEDVYVNEDVNEDLVPWSNGIIQIYERCWFEKLIPEQYNHKLKLLWERWILEWYFIQEWWTVEKVWEDDNWFPIYSSVQKKTPDWTKILLKAMDLEKRLPNSKREVKDFRWTLYTFLSPKK